MSDSKIIGGYDIAMVCYRFGLESAWHESLLYLVYVQIVYGLYFIISSAIDTCQEIQSYRIAYMQNSIYNNCM